MSIESSQSDSIDPKTPRTPLGSGGIASHKHYWDMRRKDIENRDNE